MKTDVGIGKLQTYSMDSQYESQNLAEFDVVRSTQFVDDLSRGVYKPLHFRLEFFELENDKVQCLRFATSRRHNLFRPRFAIEL